MSIYPIKNTTVGLIVRGKNSPDHKPELMAQHADCLLPGGQPVGFYGGAGDASSGTWQPASINSFANGPSISLNNTGLNMKGMVAFYNDLLKIRPMYVDINLAKRYKIKSTVILLDITKSQAELFSQYWKNLKLNPGSFHIIGANCSTHAAEAFQAAKIISSGIPGLDTPDNLFKHLNNKYLGKSRVFSGFIGTLPKGAGQYELVVE